MDRRETMGPLHPGAWPDGGASLGRGVQGGANSHQPRTFGSPCSACTGRGRGWDSGVRGSTSRFSALGCGELVSRGTFLPEVPGEVQLLLGPTMLVSPSPSGAMGTSWTSWDGPVPALEPGPTCPRLT